MTLGSYKESVVFFVLFLAAFIFPSMLFPVDITEIGEEFFTTEEALGGRGIEFVVGKEIYAVKKLIFSLGLSLDYLTGYSQYEIKGIEEGVSWKSRLQWPLDSLLIGLVMRLNIYDKFILNLAGRTNVTRDPGEIEDTDWLYGQKAAFGKVDTQFSSNIFDCNFTWNFLQEEKITLGLGAGYNYQYFDWDADNKLTQTYYTWGFGYPPGTYVFPPEEWITYKINYHLPYLIANGDYSFSKGFTIKAFARIIYAIANDEDDHVNRSKLSKANYNGTGLTLGGEATYFFISKLYGTIFLQYFYLKADGNQDQRFYAGTYSGLEYNDIDAETESQQLYAGIRFGYSF